MSVQWSNTNKADLNGLNIMVYGPPGVGKTRLISTLPAPLIISSERGNLTLKGFDIPVAYIQNGQDLKTVYDFLKSDGGKTIKSVALDSVSDIAETMLGIAKRSNNDVRQAYGQIAELIIDWMKKFRDLPHVHKYFVAQMAPFKDEVTGQIKWGPDFPGKQIGKSAPYIFDLLLRAGVHVDEKGERTYYLQTKADQFYDAKDRSDALDAYEQSDFNIILNKVAGVKQP